MNSAHLLNRYFAAPPGRAVPQPDGTLLLVPDYDFDDRLLVNLLAAGSVLSLIVGSLLGFAPII